VAKEKDGQPAEKKEKKAKVEVAAEGKGEAKTDKTEKSAAPDTAGAPVKKGKKKEAGAEGNAPSPAPAPAATGGAVEAAAPEKKEKAGDGEAPKKVYRRVRHAPSKRFVKERESLADKVKSPLPVPAAVKLLKGTKALKFDQTVECIVHLGIDPKQADQLVRGSLSLPHGVGKTNRVIVFCADDQAEKAKSAGAIDAGLDALAKKVGDGWLDFDVAVATPDVMGKIARLGRVLGPQGKMPNPKSGTVSADIVGAVREHTAGKIQFRNDAGANIHAKVGKFSFDEKKLVENISAFIDHIRRLKPSSAKGVYLKKAVIKGTMTPAVPVDVVTGAEKGED
jgi:large subunit ribosomal protein L1